MLSEFALHSSVYEAIDKLMPLGGTILELGSGEGDANLVSKYEVYAVEHDPEWLGKVPGVHYIYAPLAPIKPTRWHPKQDRWYSPEKIRATIPKLQYDLLIVDGPTADVGRGGFLKYWNLFNTNVPIILDDVNRSEEWKMLRVLSNKIDKAIVLPPTRHEKLFAVIGDKKQLENLL